MELILSQDVPQLGKTGDVVKVKEGYARNFLIPRRMACAATAGNLKRIEQLEKKRKIQHKARKAEGFDMDKKQIIIEKPIEELGIFEVGIKLHPEVTAKIRLWVTKK